MIGWYSRKQGCVTTWLAEAEDAVVVSDCAKENVFLSSRFGVPYSRKGESPTVRLFEDSKAAVHLASNSISGEETGRAP